MSNVAEPRAALLLEEVPPRLGPVLCQDALVYLGRQVAAELDPSRLTVVVRLAPSPALAVVGFPDEEAINRLNQLDARLQSLLHRVCYVTYDQAERDCQTLARRLSQRIGEEAIEVASFVGIPRGGLVVAGMLGYTLDLDHAQLERPGSSDGPLVVVDDCALTGSRVRRFLGQRSEREMIVALLYAHPDLRVAIKNKHPYVSDCISARDLHDYGPEEFGDDYEAWRGHWRERHPDERYWIGQTEHLCFPWSETDTARWNADTEEVEPGLSIVPPAYRLDGGSKGEANVTSLSSVQVQPSLTGPIRPPSVVFFGTVGEHTIVAHPNANVCIELSGTAAAMWHALVEHGTIDDAMGALRQAYSVDETTLRADLVDFARQLAAHDLLHVPDGSLS